MADCSYARCLQERRSIRRELQRWNKNMVYVVGLERVAEELMGRRKWKIYQDVVLARNLPMQASPEDGDQQAPDHNSDDEESSMLAAAELDQAGSPRAAGPLAQDKPSAAGDSPSPTAPNQAEADPASDTPTSKDTSVTQTNSDDNNGEALQPPKEQKQQILKIKTIEEINTVKKDGAEEKTTTILESLIKRSSAGPPRRTQPLVQMQPQQPVDWQPQDKCNFCVDGELVRPAAVTQDVVPEQPPSPVESESGSSSSRSAVSPPRPQFQLPAPQAQALAHLLQLQQARSNPALNQMQAMTLAAMAALGGAGNACGYPPMLLQHWMGQQQRAAVTPERVSAESEKNSAASPSAVAASAGPNSEQPLDLSAKSAPTPGAASCSPSPPGLEQRLAPLRVPINDKNLFNRSKPRLPGAAGGRRAYSDAELQMALRDIQSGRLGTRRAAVLYNIPRSTLRNKVYKMAVEREREASVPGQIPTERDDSNDIADDVDDDKDSIMDEDKDDDRENPQTMLSMNDILRISQMDNAGYGADSIRAMLQKNEQKFFDMKSPTRDTQSDLWPGIAPNVMRPYLQSLLINSLGAASIPKTEENNTAPMMPEIARLLAEEKNNILKGQLMKREHMNNGKQPDFSEDELNKNLYSRQSSSASSVITRNDRVTPGIKPDSPDDMAMDVTEHNESGESPSNVILKIPSFQPSAQGSKNGGETFPGSITPPLPYFSHSPLPGGQLGSRTGDRFSPSLGLNQGILSLKDVIAKSISDKFQQQGPTHQNHNNDMHQMGSSRSPGMDAMEGLSAFKRERLSSSMGAQGGISVIKNMSHDLTRSFSNNNSANQNQQNNAAGGKGTRPKRGKYRNYDRDSLVEAVKAVQRGEMSVHRAGSYYGVPHSTLEYKVKERHLMRPRKREPKPPLPDEKMTPGASKPSDLTPGSSVRNDKAKPIQKPPMKPNFPAGSPNGLKMPPIFDGGLALGYNPSTFPFWPHPPPFHRLSVDFNPRNPTPGATGFPTNPESFFASQMMQRLQEESARQPGGSESANSIMNSAREMAEQYENAVGGANGSFLEGIIRNRLEQPTGPPGQEEGDTVRRRLRPDDLLLAEEMREAARRLRARDGVTASPTIAPHLPPHPS